MRYLKVLLLVVLVFLVLVFFFQNQTALSQNIVFTLNLFFIAPMTSIPLPVYFIVLAAFFIGAVLSLCFLVWDKVNLSARLMKGKWQISSLERETAKLRKQIEGEAARSDFLRTAAQKETEQKKAAQASSASASAPLASSAPAAGADTARPKAAPAALQVEDITAPDPDKG